MGTLGTVSGPIGISQAAPGEPSSAKKPAMRDVITHEQLMARRQASKEAEPMAKFEKAEGEDPAKINPPQDIISQSEFLSSSGNMTLVPKRAILHIPDRLRDRTVKKDGMKIMTWPSFFAKNRTWITTIEVSRQQAEGILPIDEKRFESMQQTGDVIVATMGGSPISVLPLKIPEDTDEEEEDGAVETGRQQLVN